MLKRNPSRQSHSAFIPPSTDLSPSGFVSLRGIKPSKNPKPGIHKALCLLLIVMLVTSLNGCRLVEDAGNGQKAGSGAPVRIGTMATEDFLPYWLAEQKGLFESAGLNVSINVFQSAHELSTAMAAGEIDMAMTDPMVSISLAAGGTAIQILWVTLGQTAEQGRFGILAHPDSGIVSLSDLAGVPVAIGSNTIPEYTYDRLMAAAGVPAGQIVYEEVKMVPVRFEMVSNNQVAAAALPASLLYLGEKTGLVLIADDSAGENISQTVMIAREDFVTKQSGTDVLQRLQETWDSAVKLVNADPESCRQLLVEKTQLPLPIADDYPVPTYPEAKLAADWMIDNVLDWMTAKSYLTVNVAYEPATGRLVVPN
ncbi:MAG: MetQ/NlpA family ABC transporter substrate-binding protein [Coriobacteriia bacterium]|nr:MetQ/NlpA family ABC transporter substrate-binding protein [Coriobacteriia bacterium]